MNPLAPLASAIQFPAQVAERVLRDLDAMAEVARSVPRVIALLESLDQTAKQVLALGERIDRRAEAILGLGEALEQRAEAILGLGGRIDERGAELVALGERFNVIGDQMLTEANLVHTRAAEVVETAREMITVLPAIRRAVELGEPLEGAIERFARIVERIPGGPSTPARRPAAIDEPG